MGATTMLYVCFNVYLNTCVESVFHWHRSIIDLWALDAENGVKMAKENGITFLIIVTFHTIAIDDVS